MSKATEQDREEKLKMIEIVRHAIQSDESLRAKYKMGDKFRFIRDRLNNLLKTLESSLPSEEKNASQKGSGLQEGEVIVYVYLYNSQGLQFRSWQNLMNPKVFYEYSVNRPIYAEKSHIEALLRTKINKAQHAYLSIAVQSGEILKSTDDQVTKDNIGNPVIKVKEGSLRINKVILFTHQDQNYTLNENGELISK